MMDLKDNRNDSALMEYMTEEQKTKLSQAAYKEMYSRITYPVEFREEQKKTIGQLKWGVLIWLLLDLIIVIFSAYNFWGFRLHSSILVALLTSTTAGIIGLLVIVLYWLYPHNKQ